MENRIKFEFMFKKIKNKIVKVMIEKLIASLLESFKTSNPKIWGIIVLILTTVKVAIEHLISIGSIPEGADWIEWVFWGIALLLGSGGVLKYTHQKELDGMEDDPVVAHARTQKEEMSVLRDQNDRLKEIIRNA